MTAWRPVVGWKGVYEVSDQGDVRSMGRWVLSRSKNGLAYMRFLQPKMLSTAQDRKGYPYFFLNKSHDKKRKYVHVAVLEAFVGLCPPGLEACHENGNTSDPALGNLRWDTSKNNAADRRRHGTHLEGEDVPTAKLTDKEARAILADPRLHRVIAAEYRVSRSTVGGIKSGTTWKHLNRT